MFHDKYFKWLTGILYPMNIQDREEHTSKNIGAYSMYKFKFVQLQYP